MSSFCVSAGNSANVGTFAVRSLTELGYEEEADYFRRFIHRSTAGTAKELNAACEGQQLCVSLSYRATTDDCPEGSCTVVDIVNLKLGDPACCVVANGTCKIKATLLASDLENFVNGRATGIELHGCGLAPRFPLGADPAVTCGIVLK